MSKTAYIKSIPRKSAQKRSEYTTMAGRRLNKTKAGAGVGTVFAPSVDFKMGRLRTGMEKQVVNKWHRATKEESNLPSEWYDSDIWKKPMITLQESFEIQHNQKRGFYTSEKPKMLGRKKGEARTFLQSFKYRLDDGITILDLEKPRDQIMLQLAKASNIIANSKQEAEFSKIAEFFISRINEDEEEKASKNKIKRKAVALFYDLSSKHTFEQMLMIGRILEVVNSDAVSQEKLENAIDDFINKPSPDQLENIKSFIKYSEMLKDKEGIEVLEARVLLIRLVENRIINDHQETYKWHSKSGTAIGEFANTLDEAVSFLLNPNKQEYREELEAELKSKTNY